MNAVEFERDLSGSMMKRFSIYIDFNFLHNFNGPGLCFAKRIPTIPKTSCNNISYTNLTEIYRTSRIPAFAFKEMIFGALTHRGSKWYILATRVSHGVLCL
ncbi:hypothetical protein CFP56_018854 [Quercus suber]|uniref:Uncharacterized protein n=1 Tax=Quercus suber TaxID=58331 RepID=A0AAW0KHX6_QUESU